MTGPAIPLVDLRPQHEELQVELSQAVRDVVDSNCYTDGPFVEAFEADLAEYLDVPWVVGVSSGTDALRIALRVVGVRGRRIGVPALTFAATAEAVLQAGAEPVFLDINPHELVLTEVPPWLDGVIPVHLHGRISPIERYPGDFVVEDACQALGSVRNGRPAGTVGTLGVFSFYPTKNLGAWGDGGAICGHDPDLKIRCLRLRDHGKIDKHTHLTDGYTARLDALQAAVLNVKLKRLRAWNVERYMLVDHYRKELFGVGDLILPRRDRDFEWTAWHIMAVRTAFRDALALHLKLNDIATGVHYPAALHQQPAFRTNQKLPHAERAAETLLSLPLFPGMSGEQLLRVCDNVRTFFAQGEQR